MAGMMDYAGGGMPPMNGDMAAAGPPGMGMPGGMPGGMPPGGMPGGAPPMGGGAPPMGGGRAVANRAMA